MLILSFNLQSCMGRAVGDMSEQSSGADHGAHEPSGLSPSDSQSDRCSPRGTEGLVLHYE